MRACQQDWCWHPQPGHVRMLVIALSRSNNQYFRVQDVHECTTISDIRCGILLALDREDGVHDLLPPLPAYRSYLVIFQSSTNKARRTLNHVHEIFPLISQGSPNVSFPNFMAFAYDEGPLTANRNGVLQGLNEPSWLAPSVVFGSQPHDTDQNHFTFLVGFAPLCNNETARWSLQVRGASRFALLRVLETSQFEHQQLVDLPGVLKIGLPLPPATRSGTQKTCVLFRHVIASFTTMRPKLSLQSCARRRTCFLQHVFSIEGCITSNVPLLRESVVS